MKRAIIIGCPGSGKSTFARALHQKIGVPLYHLDLMYWNADKTIVPKSLFLSRLAEVMGKDEWIIDGNYASTMEMRISECDTVFFLDLPVDVCLDGISQRRGKTRPDIPWIEDGDDAEFLEFIKSYNAQQRPQVLKLLEKYKDKRIIIFTSREQAESFLNR